MKHIFLILSLFVFNKGCSGDKSQQEETITVEYRAISRGGLFKHIMINNKNISTISKNGETSKPKTCSETEWEKLVSAYKTIDAKAIPNLKAPSKKFMFDGAAIATLKITINDTVYTTESFDHGNPPKEIKALVDEILLVSENVE